MWHGLLYRCRSHGCRPPTEVFAVLESTTERLQDCPIQIRTGSSSPANSSILSHCCPANGSFLPYCSPANGSILPHCSPHYSPPCPTCGLPAAGRAACLPATTLCSAAAVRLTSGSPCTQPASTIAFGSAGSSRGMRRVLCYFCIIPVCSQLNS